MTQKEFFITSGDIGEPTPQQLINAMEHGPLDQVFRDLIDRVVDWKNYNPATFGKLLRYGIHRIVPSPSNKSKIHEVFFCERVILCCKQIPDKPSSLTSRWNGQLRLKLVGRVFMKDITNVVTISENDALEAYGLQIWYLNEIEIHNFIVYSHSSEARQRWIDMIDEQRANIR